MHQHANVTDITFFSLDTFTSAISLIQMFIAEAGIVNFIDKTWTSESIRDINFVISTLIKKPNRRQSQFNMKIGLRQSVMY
jgi:hypothetical protein